MCAPVLSLTVDEDEDDDDVFPFFSSRASMVCLMISTAESTPPRLRHGPICEGRVRCAARLRQQRGMIQMAS